MSTATTRAYFGDGVYAEFTGYDIVLTANGTGADATDKIHLEPQMLDGLRKWMEDGFRDHTSGRTFGDQREAS